MFQKAYAKARHFTKPVVISTRTVGGKARSDVGSYVVLNQDGWILTAFHVLGACVSLVGSTAKVQACRTAVAATKSDKALTPKAKKAKLRELGEPKADEIEHYASWWGENGVTVGQVAGIPEVDIAVGRLSKFDPASVAVYPEIKDPTKNFEPGVSLCKLGYPFHELPIGWDEKTKGFVGDNVAFTLFPIEGMLTRFMQDPKWVALQQAQKLPFPLLRLETSTPGLKGQSGGPIFDVLGRIWAVQVLTAHLSLGFDPEVKDKGGAKRREHQFLNVGHGVHAATIVGLLNQLGIRFELSKD
jgi:hypothetical protein